MTGHHVQYGSSPDPQAGHSQSTQPPNHVHVLGGQQQHQFLSMGYQPPIHAPAPAHPNYPVHATGLPLAQPAAYDGHSAIPQQQQPFTQSRLPMNIKQEPATLTSQAAPGMPFEYEYAQPQLQHHVFPTQHQAPINPAFPVDSANSQAVVTQPTDPSRPPQFHAPKMHNGTAQGLPTHEWLQPGKRIAAVGSKPTASLPSKAGPGGNKKPNSPAKVPRHQFTACGACRHRRVKCDLRARQEEAERPAMGGDSSTVRRKVSCTNCEERGTNCVDEYAPLKAAKQLRRGKRISEIEMLYGKSATYAALASQGDDMDRSLSQGPKHLERIPDLTREFFDSPFYRRFNIERPIIDPYEFETRYFSKSIPCAAAMGPEGSILCHCLYAWAVSYGVDERGQVDVASGALDPIGPVDLFAASEGEQKHEGARQQRREKMTRVVRFVLREIDEAGMMRRPSWDGVRCLLLILPLTDGIAPSVERQAMYQATISQVYLLCSQNSQDYDGLPVIPPPTSSALVALNKNVEERQRTVKMRIYWYTFIHECLATGLRGGRFHFDQQEDVAEDLHIEEAIGPPPLTPVNGHFENTRLMATSTVRFALACRMINKALTGPGAKRQDAVRADLVHAVWEVLEKTWEELDELKNNTPEGLQGERYMDEVLRVLDGWKIYIFEAQNVMLQNLEERRAKLTAKANSQGAFLSDAGSGSRSVSPVSLSDDLQRDLTTLQHLIDIARSKNEVRCYQILDIVRSHIGGLFFEWDSNRVRDGLYYTAMQLVREGGRDEDIALCIQAINEVRWAHAKAAERSEQLRKAWFEARSRPVQSPPTLRKPSSSASQSNHSLSPFTSPSIETPAMVPEISGQPAQSAPMQVWGDSPALPTQIQFSSQPAEGIQVDPSVAHSSNPPHIGGQPFPMFSHSTTPPLGASAAQCHPHPQPPQVGQLPLQPAYQPQQQPQPQPSQQPQHHYSQPMQQPPMHDPQQQPFLYHAQGGQLVVQPDGSQVFMSYPNVLTQQ